MPEEWLIMPIPTALRSEKLAIAPNEMSLARFSERDGLLAAQRIRVATMIPSSIFRSIERGAS
ncbi:hypothetical protein GXY_11768 [Novacetimonas hansenii ATCC 23769]|uniref:Uncharacterized protein n=1 Tax=Novacetimonas hansenii ATCC 23769 TaxID=714995 RepID=D5QGT1_NOVHA|nr:hypothetical protein GXY_11768 [Novacetimonas hansenii ATCC 23769]